MKVIRAHQAAKGLQPLALSFSKLGYFDSLIVDPSRYVLRIGCFS